MMALPDVSEDDFADALDLIREEHDNCEVNAVLANLDAEHLLDRLEGRGGGLRSSKPDAPGDNGLIQYVWRIARLHSGDDPCMPVTASWWLSEWCEEKGIHASVSGVMDEDGKAVTSALHDVATVALLALGRNPSRGAERWEGLAF